MPTCAAPCGMTSVAERNEDWYRRYTTSPYVRPTYGYTVSPNRRSPQRGTVGGSHSKKYSHQHGFLYGYATTQNNARIAGRFTPDNQEQRRVNADTAAEFQQLVVKNIGASIKRPKVSSGRLLTATADEANAVSGVDYWGVGIPEYLDRSKAKYWRTIEEGTARVWKRSFIGDPLIGAWGYSVTGPHMSERWGEVMRASGKLEGAWQGSTGGKFRPWGKSERRRQALGISRFGGTGSRVHRIPRVGKEIEGMDAYVKAWKQIGGADEMLRRMAWIRQGLARPGVQHLTGPTQSQIRRYR